MTWLMIEDVVTQHAEEASFLALLHDSAVRAAHFRLRDLGNLDERLEAHLDGLRIAGEAGWAIAKEQLSTGEPGEVFSAAILAFEALDGKRTEDVFRVVADRL